jgi:hypothetical protein
VVGALFFGCFMYWFTSSRTRQLFDLAREAPAAVPEAAGDTRLRSLYAVLVVAAAFLLIDLVFRDSASDSGIVIGAGLAQLAVASRIDSWESEYNVRLLRQAGPARRLSNFTWRGMDPNRYRLLPIADSSQVPATVPSDDTTVERIRIGGDAARRSRRSAPSCCSEYSSGTSSSPRNTLTNTALVPTAGFWVPYCSREYCSSWSDSACVGGPSGRPVVG